MRVLFQLILVLALVAVGGWAWVSRSRLPAAERGRRLAEREGCFACHGPGGARGAANPGRLDRTVPTFEGDVMMYAKSDDDLREWILDGVTQRKAASRTWREQSARGVLRMPKFRERLDRREVAQLVAYINATAGNPEPEDSLARSGLDRSAKLGCRGCHGPGGRLALPNPGSLKGYVPSWDGGDFSELVRDRKEFHEWVSEGVSRRFRGNPAAMFFLRRATLHMPGYRDHMGPGDEDALWAYVTWLRATPH